MSIPTRTRPARRLLSAAVAFTLLLLALACQDADAPLPPAGAVAAVDVSPDARELAAGDTATLAATPRDAVGRPLPGRAVAWTSSDTAVVAVTSAGRAIARRPGAAIVAATSEGRVGRAAITVRPGPLARLTLDPASALLARGEARPLAATGHDAAGNVVPVGAVVWASSDPAVATVTTGGPTAVVVAVAPGTTVITASAEGRSARAEVTVTPPARAPVDRVEVTPTAVVLERGATRQLTAVLRDASGNVLTGRAVTWTTDAPATAAVSATGLVTALAPGYATIVATSEGRTFGVAVTVPTPQMTEYQLLLVNGSPVPRTLFTTTETGPDGVARTVRWVAQEGLFRMGGGQYEQLVHYWILRENAPAVQGTYGYRGTFLYDVLDGGIVFHPADGGPAFRGALVDGTLIVARQLVPGTPELTFVHRLP